MKNICRRHIEKVIKTQHKWNFPCKRNVKQLNDLCIYHQDLKQQIHLHKNAIYLCNHPARRGPCKQKVYNRNDKCFYHEKYNSLIKDAGHININNIIIRDLNINDCNKQLLKVYDLKGNIIKWNKKNGS